MDVNKRKIATVLSTILLLHLSVSCSEKGLGRVSKEPVKLEGAAQTYIELVAPGFTSKSAMPDENLLSDLNIFIFSSKGELEESRWIQTKELEEVSEAGTRAYRCNIPLLLGNRYTIYVCANIGYRLRLRSIEECESLEYYLTRPDDYRGGMPMSTCLKDVILESDGILRIELERCMARIRLRMDRCQMSEDVDFTVRSVRICGCPKSVRLFGKNSAQSKDDFFAQGFMHYDMDADALNEIHTDGKSDMVELYMLENRQGEKLSELCSYIEMKAEYVSKSMYTNPGELLTYRFYLGDGRKDFEVCRNCSYTVTVTPMGDGLGSNSGDGNQEDGSRGSLEWRIDKSELNKFVKSVEISHGSLSFNYKGQTQQLAATVLPEDAGNTFLVWESSNTEVASVSSNGLVTAEGNGSCTITCWSTDGSMAKSECKVDVGIEKAWVTFHNTGYQESRIGSTLHIWADYFPPNMSCKIDKDYLDFDVERGIYSYELSEDHSSVMLHMLKKGSGMIRFDVGEPLDTSALVLIVVEP